MILNPPKGAVFGVQQVYTRSYYNTSLDKQSAANHTIKLLRYGDDSPVPLWYEENKGIKSTVT